MLKMGRILQLGSEGAHKTLVSCRRRGSQIRVSLAGAPRRGTEGFKAPASKPDTAPRGTRSGPSAVLRPCCCWHRVLRKDQRSQMALTKVTAEDSLFFTC